jgi:hypothetical protein
VIRLRLRDIEVLAKGAAHVASGSSHREDASAREEMIERLLLYRIHGESRRTSVAELEQFSAFVLADKAKAVLSFADVTMPRT